MTKSVVASVEPRINLEISEDLVILAKELAGKIAEMLVAKKVLGFTFPPDTGLVVKSITLIATHMKDIKEIYYNIKFEVDAITQIVDTNLKIMHSSLDKINTFLAKIDNSASAYLSSKGAQLGNFLGQKAVQLGKTIGHLGIRISEIVAGAGRLLGVAGTKLGVLVQEAKKWVAAVAATGIIRWSALKFSLKYLLKPVIAKGISTVIKGILHVFSGKLMKLILGVFSAKVIAVTAKLIATIVGIAAGLAALALVGKLIADALVSKPPKAFATGGFPAHGQMFIAREAGPELVGNLSGRTAVVNNDQIVEAVSVGVFQAWKAAWDNKSLNDPAIARVFLDGKQVTSTVERVQKERGLPLMSGGVVYGF